jgi:mono/diheme cytochrome c family protein
MKHSKIKTHSFPVRTAAMLSMIIFGMAVVTSAFKEKDPVPTDAIKFDEINRDSIESVTAFKSVYKVLMSPRCMNCHPAGDVPLQGDDSHLHTMAPKRGQDGKGVYAMKCSNCHQDTNTPGLHTPPGNPDWHLPPADMRMVFEGKTANELAKQLVDPNQNGHKDMKKLIEHADDGLVLAGWNPGEGRTLPPMSHAEFKKAWLTWLKKGAYAPKK